MTRLLIANRGEIVVRIAATARRLGLSVVTISSAADANAPWHSVADDTVVFDADASSATYANRDAVIAAALETECDAIHPGYGFLSEDAEFASAVERAGLIFVGPPATAIALLGDKAAAKTAAAALGIPTLDAFGSASADVDIIVQDLAGVSDPVLLKPVYGGGGKGMVAVHPGDDVREAVSSAVRLNQRNFGRGDVMIERYVPRPRHVEVQVLFDSHGHGVHFFTRECSLQRRNQKVIEQAPASSVPAAVLDSLQTDAVALLASVGYVNAGTVEFLVDDAGKYYFLEVNTRLQVEHTVTEEVTGVDLVELQLDVALGRALPLAQNDIAVNGFAIQARIYAEDPLDDFRPAPVVDVFTEWPSDTRVDAAFTGPGSVPPFYDPMLAKVIATGKTRAVALEALDRALLATRYFGGASNIGFLRALLADPAVRSDDVHTTHIDTTIRSLLPDVDDLREKAAAVAVVAYAVGIRSADTTSPWAGAAGTLDRKHLRSAHPEPSGTDVEVDGVLLTLSAVRVDELRWTVDIGERRVFVTTEATVESSSRRTTIVGTADGVDFSARSNGTESWVSIAGWSHRVAKRLFAGDGSDAAGDGITSHMPGTVMSVLESGSRVSAGDVVAVVEAMKMESALRSPVDGEVVEVTVKPGDVVDANKTIARVVAVLEAVPA